MIVAADGSATTTSVGVAAVSETGVAVVAQHDVDHHCANLAELLAIELALDLRPSKILTDSSYSIEVLTEVIAPRNGDGPAAERILGTRGFQPALLHKVKGHGGNRLHNRADTLAMFARRGRLDGHIEAHVEDMPHLDVSKCYRGLHTAAGMVGVRPEQLGQSMEQMRLLCDGEPTEKARRLGLVVSIGGFDNWHSLRVAERVMRLTDRLFLALSRRQYPSVTPTQVIQRLTSMEHWTEEELVSVIKRDSRLRLADGVTTLTL